MAIEFKCQGCQKTLRVPDEFAGRKAKCPNCQTILQVAAKNETVDPLEVKPPIESSSDLFAGLDSSDSPTSSYEPSSGDDRSPFASSNPYRSPQSQQPQSFRGGEPHRGGLILGLGIAGFVCCFITGVLALILGLNDLKAMKEGRMDDRGHGLTLAGTIMGGIATALSVLGIVLSVIASLLGA